MCQRKATKRKPQVKCHGAKGAFWGRRRATLNEKITTCLALAGVSWVKRVCSALGLGAVLRLEVRQRRALPRPQPALRLLGKGLRRLMPCCFSRQWQATVGKCMPKCCRTELCPSASGEFSVGGENIGNSSAFPQQPPALRMAKLPVGKARKIFS